jgi:hypothetical protein
VNLTVHRGVVLDPQWAIGGGPVHQGHTEAVFLTVTNASPEQDIVVTHVWLETTPPFHIVDRALPVRLKYSAPWETFVFAENLPEGTEDVEWLARCQITPDDKVIKSRPRKNVPPIGAVPRG